MRDRPRMDGLGSEKAANKSLPMEECARKTCEGTVTTERIPAKAGMTAFDMQYPLITFACTRLRKAFAIIHLSAISKRQGHEVSRKTVSLGEKKQSLAERIISVGERIAFLRLDAAKKRYRKRMFQKGLNQETIPSGMGICQV